MNEGLGNNMRGIPVPSPISSQPGRTELANKINQVVERGKVSNNYLKSDSPNIGVPIGTVLRSQPDGTPILINGIQKNGYIPSQYEPPRSVFPHGTPTFAHVPELPRAPTPVQIDAAAPPIDKMADDKFRADYRVKLSILREAYPNMNIPDIRDDQTHEQIIAVYKEYVKKIHIDSSVESNSTYLIILWLLLEVVGSKFLHLPTQGYFQNQLKYMNKYQMLLIELGETSYMAGVTDGWPIEVRILTMAIFNAVIFIVVKMLAGRFDEAYGDKIRELIDDFLTNNGNKGKTALKRAEEADSTHVPDPQPKPNEPLGGFGPLLSQMMGMFLGGDESKGAPGKETPAPEAKPKRKRPMGFADRTKDKVVESDGDDE